MSQHLGKDITNIETDQQLRKVVAKIAMGEQWTKNKSRTIRAERVEGSKIGAVKYSKESW